MSIIVFVGAPGLELPMHSLMQSATNIKLANKEERALLCVWFQGQSVTGVSG